MLKDASLNKISTSGLGSDLRHSPRSVCAPSPSQSPSFRPYLASRPCCLLSECLALKAKEHGVGRGKTRNPPKDETLNTSIYILQVFLAGGNRIFTELLCRVQKRVWLGYNNIQCISLDFTFELEKEPGTWVIVFHQNNLQGFRVIKGLSCMIWPIGRQGLAATLGQHCPQMTQRPGRAWPPPAAAA